MCINRAETAIRPTFDRTGIDVRVAARVSHGRLAG